MLFHLAYIQMVGGLLPTIIELGAKIGFGAKQASRLPKSALADFNVCFTAAELDEFRKSSDVARVRELHASATARGKANEGDEHCAHCGCAKTSLLFHVFNSQMILTEEEWTEMNETTDASRYRHLVALGRRNAGDMRRLYHTALTGFDACPFCGASRSA